MKRAIARHLSDIGPPAVVVPDPSGVGSSVRPPTAEELATSTSHREKLEAARRTLEAAKLAVDHLTAECPHTVIVDELGFSYVNRWCHACGGHLGFI